MRTSLLALPLFALLSVFLMLTACRDQADHLELSLSESQLQWVGQMVFQNECAGREACLVHWNAGEAFPSLGIGHFIWYPAGVDGPFVESFPRLISFMREQSLSPPEWLLALQPLDAPWPDRQAFLQQENSSRVQSLREFLAGTKGAQAAFMFDRARTSLASVLEAAPAGQREQIRDSLVALASTAGGTYALIDYVNFKGEGLAERERYNGQGWGLLQVLEHMPQSDAADPLERFREAAGAVLTRRAEHAPKPIEKQQWLAGWLKRIATYREPGD
ncbi:MAG: hypothetical protein CL583_04350 [Alteromonadaceae bacterium]|nr:hypothetical protein [Alteromonadaceae bacterium]